MEPDVVLRVGREALLLTLVLSGPPVLAALVLGLAVSLLQAATQIQEQTLTFVPKLVGIFAVLAILGAWMIRVLVQFSTALLDNLPRLVH